MRTSLSNARQSHAWRLIKLACRRWTAVDGDQRSAAFAFYLLLSLLPLIILFVAAGSLLVEEEVATREVVKSINRYMPLTGGQEHYAETAVRDMLSARGTIGLVALPLLVWGALKFLRTLIRTSSRIWSSRVHNWWQLQLKGLGLLGLAACAVSFGVIVPIMVRWIQQGLTTDLEIPSWVFGLAVRLMPWIALFVVLTAIYKLAPSRTTRLADVWIEGLAATVLIWASGQLFLLQAAYLGRFSALYGSLGVVVAFLLWIYLSSCICVFGICFCAAWAEIRESAADLPGKRRA